MRAGRRTLTLRGRPEGAGGSPPAAELLRLGSEVTQVVEQKIWGSGHTVCRLDRRVGSTREGNIWWACGGS